MLSVCWEGHEAAVRSHMLRYFRDEAFVDVTLWCAGRRFKAHRAMLSACSALLERLLLEHPRCAGEPVTVLLHGVEAADARRLLQLMYRGQARVPAHQLPRLLDAAAALGVRLLDSSALRVQAAGGEGADDEGPDLCTEASCPSEKDTETVDCVTVAEPPLRTGGSPAGQPGAHGPTASLAAPPPAPPPPPPPPVASVTPIVGSPLLLPPLLAAEPAPLPSTMDWLQTHLPGVPLPPVLEELQPAPAPQTPGDPDADRSTPANALQQDAIASMVTAPMESLSITNPTVSQSNERNGSWVKPNDQSVSIQTPPQTRGAPWARQPCSFPLQNQGDLEGESSVPKERPVAVASGHEQPPPPPDLRSLLEAQPPPPRHPQPPAALTGSPLQPSAETLSDVPALFSADERQDVNTGGGGPLLQTLQPVLPDDAARQPTKESAPETKPNHKKDNICEVCGKNFSTRYSLKVHRRTHTGEKPHRCEQCGKRFSQRRNYRYHLSLHSGSREFEAACPECGKVFSDRGYLSSHRKIHRDAREYACAQCGRRFNQRVAYTTHARTHSGERPHRCPVCGKGFTRKGLLRQHARLHDAQQPFLCQVCGQRFADGGALSLHGRLHACPRPFQCAHCGCSFFKKSHLRAHLAGACAPPQRQTSVIFSTAAATVTQLPPTDST